jgi:DNA adenine methylase
MALSPVSSANVASVPQRSLFRYPGGKTWLVPQIRAWLKSQPARPRLLIEPFAGGGIIALTAVAENLVDRAVLAELDPHVAAVWRVIISGDAETLARRIERFQFTYDNVRAELDKQPRSDMGLAFQTILRNRAQRGGIMARRAGLMKMGERGNGLASRWYPDTLARRIRDITAYASRIEFITGDGLPVIKQYANQSRTVLFADPPYTAGGKNAGSRLYKSSTIDHAHLFQLTKGFKGDVLLTYDDSPEVRDLASESGLMLRPITMRSTHHSKMQELLIGRDLSWVL